MSSALPLRIDPRRLAEQRVSLRGTLSFARMQRLARFLLVAEGIVQMSLCLDRKAGGLNIVAGEIKTQVEMECQRCLKMCAAAIEAVDEENATRKPFGKLKYLRTS